MNSETNDIRIALLTRFNHVKELSELPIIKLSNKKVHTACIINLTHDTIKIVLLPKRGSDFQRAVYSNKLNKLFSF